VRFPKSLFRHSLGPAHYVFALVFFVRIIVLARLATSPFLLPQRGDMHFYDDWAQRIAHGQWTEHVAFYGLPLYAYLLALIYKIAGYNPYLPGLLQAVIDAATAVILYKIGVNIFSASSERPPAGSEGKLANAFYARRGQIVGISAAIGWALFVPAQTYAVILMPTVWLVFIFWFLVWRITRNDNAPSALESLAYGMAIGFTAMGVATVFVLIPLLVAAIVLNRSRAGKPPFGVKATSISLLFVGIAAGTSPCWIHNYFIARDPVFLSAHSGVNFWIGNNPIATGYPRFPPGLHAGQEAMLKDSIKAAETAAGHPLKRAQVSAYWSAKANDYIRHHFGEWLKLLAVKIKNFWSAFQYDDLSMITTLREHGVLFPSLRFGLVAALAIPGLLIAWRRRPQSRWIAAAIFLQMVALLPVFITERYRLAVVPGLLLFAAFGLSDLWEAVARKQIQTILTYFALIVGSTIFVGWPVRDRSLWALDTYNSGWQAFESNDLPLAEQKLKLAYAYVPDNAETNFALGNLRLAQGNKSEAKSYYLATLRLDQTHEGSYNNLGVLALEEGHWNIAAQLFAKARQQDPRNAKTYYLLARALAGNNDLDAAYQNILRAVELGGDQPDFVGFRNELEQNRGVGHRP
jgi:tetratricopeptide (TPR) repeat protein